MEIQNGNVNLKSKIPFVWANFQGDSRASFADYTGEERVVTTSAAYSSVTMFLVYTSGVFVSHTSAAGGYHGSRKPVRLMRHGVEG